MKRKRHGAAEIAAKLDQADHLAAQGKRQSEISKTLGVSVMTYHRWRKAFPQRPRTAIPDLEILSGAKGNSEPDRLGRLAELQAENTRLRRLVTDLMLERMKLTEEANAGDLPETKRSRRYPAAS